MSLFDFLAVGHLEPRNESWVPEPSRVVLADRIHSSDPGPTLAHSNGVWYDENYK